MLVDHVNLTGDPVNHLIFKDKVPDRVESFVVGVVPVPEFLRALVGGGKFVDGGTHALLVDLEQVATARHQGRDLQLAVAKIYPQVNNGQFEVDMTFAEQPGNLRRGQTLQLKLTLGDNSDAILIPNGSFYQETGGNWIFVVSADGTEAVKRNVRLGRRNTDFIEVLDGLQNVLPAGTPRFTQTNSSNLVNAYKWAELDEQTGLAFLTLYSGITDRAEPCE